MLNTGPVLMLLDERLPERMCPLSASAIETLLGYEFANPMLLKQALTHRSYGPEHYERLEFLGDSVLNLSIARTLYHRFPDENEGRLSRLRAHLVSQEGLVFVAKHILHLGRFLILGEGEKRFFPNIPDSLLSDSLEALIGAVFLDASFDVAYALVMRLFDQSLSDLDPHMAEDPKTRLQEYVQSLHVPLPIYTVIKKTGEAHQQVFFVSCYLSAYDLTTSGEGISRRKAERDAAQKMLSALAGHPIH